MPEDSRLLLDGLRVLTRLLREAREHLGAVVVFHHHESRARTGLKASEMTRCSWVYTQLKQRAPTPVLATGERRSPSNQPRKGHLDKASEPDLEAVFRRGNVAHD